MFDISSFSFIYRRTIRGTGAAGSLVRVTLETVAAKTLRVLTHVTVENQTTAFTKVRLGISNRGVDYFLDELQTVAANELAVSRSDILLGDGDRLFAELTGTTDDDIILLNAFGWEQKL